MNKKLAPVENQNGNTLAQAPTEILKRSESEQADQIPEELRRATAFFSPAGFRRSWKLK